MSGILIIACFIWVIIMVMGLACYCDHIDTVNLQEKKVQRGKDIDYRIQYNTRNKKYYIDMFSSNGHAPITNRLRFVQHYPTATKATVEMQKMKGNFF